ncbi:glycosyltransferase [Kineococcus sp. TBRC 1896]|uniref:Glycosyltransferase n=1 Tax=Kineococcus mangrovi TaxID=1660183 RepID=A0ABV4HXS8_9ACTN
MTALLVANGGGHIRQLRQLAPRLPTGPDRHWITIDTPQTRSLLAGERVSYLRNSAPRDAVTAVKNAVSARRFFREDDVDFVVSTGNSLAVAVLPLAVARRIDTYFIESATRVSGPSLSGRLMAMLPGVHCLTQYPHLVDATWGHGGSVFDGFETTPRTPRSGPLKVVVSVGTHESYGFRRLLERMVQILPPDAEVLWQTGANDTSGLPIDARPFLPSNEFDSALRECDVLVGHAGTGTALAAMSNGLVPVLLPRRQEFDEHIDDHQLQLAGYLAEQGLAIVPGEEGPALEDLLAAARLSVRALAAPPPLRLPAPRRPLAVTLPTADVTAGRAPV